MVFINKLRPNVVMIGRHVNSVVTTMSHVLGTCVQACSLDCATMCTLALECAGMCWNVLTHPRLCQILRLVAILQALLNMHLKLNIPRLLLYVGKPSRNKQLFRHWLERGGGEGVVKGFRVCLKGEVGNAILNTKGKAV